MAKETVSPESEAVMQSPTQQVLAQPVRIQLINAIDEALILRELLSPKLLRTCEVEAVLGLDSIYLVLPPPVVRQLGLRLVDQRLVRLADGRQETVGVTEALRIEWNGKFVSEDALVMGDQVVLGQGLLQKLTFAPDAPDDLASPEASDTHPELEGNGLAHHPVDSSLTTLSTAVQGSTANRTI